jgi:hypothetical protein
MEQHTHVGSSGGSLEPHGPLLEPPGPPLTHLHTVYMAYSDPSYALEQRQAYLSFLSAANISAAMNGMYC